MAKEKHGQTFCHVSVGTNNLAAAIDFYDKVLATLAIARVSTYEHAAAYGKDYPSFWVQIPYNKATATVGNGSHIGFKANSKAEVDAFYRTAIQCGAKCNGEPGPRPEYGAPYYGAFVKDIDGNAIEASFWDFSMSMT